MISFRYLREYGHAAGQHSVKEGLWGCGKNVGIRTQRLPSALRSSRYWKGYYYHYTLDDAGNVFWLTPRRESTYHIRRYENYSTLMLLLIYKNSFSWRYLNILLVIANWINRKRVHLRHILYQAVPNELKNQFGIVRPGPLSIPPALDLGANLWFASDGAPSKSNEAWHNNHGAKSVAKDGREKRKTAHYNISCPIYIFFLLYTFLFIPTHDTKLPALSKWPC